MVGLENASNRSKKQLNIQLRSARIHRLWTIREAAQRVGVSETAYIRWEQGQQTPHLLNLQQLCTAFNLSVSELGYGHLLAEEETEQRRGRAEQEKISSLLTELGTQSMQLRELARQLTAAREAQEQLRTQLEVEQLSRQATQVQLMETHAQMDQLHQQLEEERQARRKLLAGPDMQQRPIPITSQGQ